MDQKQEPSNEPTNRYSYSELLSLLAALVANIGKTVPAANERFVDDGCGPNRLQFNPADNRSSVKATRESYTLLHD